MLLNNWDPPFGWHTRYIATGSQHSEQASEANYSSNLSRGRFAVTIVAVGVFVTFCGVVRHITLTWIPTRLF